MDALAEHGVELPVPPDGPVVRMVDLAILRELFCRRTPAEGTPRLRRQIRYLQFKRALVHLAWDAKCKQQRFQLAAGAADHDPCHRFVTIAFHRRGRATNLTPRLPILIWIKNQTSVFASASALLLRERDGH
jgi:hypothetical protein